MGELAPAAVAYLSGREGRVSVAVILPGSSEKFSFRGDEPYGLASLMKVPLMLAFMDRVEQEGRGLTPEDVDLRTAMIIASENEPAALLWAELNSDRALMSYLASVGHEDFFLEPGATWGWSLGTAEGVAGLFAALAPDANLEAPGPAMLALARALLEGVIEEQRWGVTAAETHAEAAVIGLKNGWAPNDDDEEHWRVHSAAYFSGVEGFTAYAIAVLSADQPSFEYGIETVEEAARLIHEELHSRD